MDMIAVHTYTTKYTRFNSCAAACSHVKYMPANIWVDFYYIAIPLVQILLISLKIRASVNPTSGNHTNFWTLVHMIHVLNTCAQTFGLF